MLWHESYSQTERSVDEQVVCRCSRLFAQLCLSATTATKLAPSRLGALISQARTPLPALRTGGEIDRAKPLVALLLHTVYQKHEWVCGHKNTSFDGSTEWSGQVVASGDYRSLVLRDAERYSLRPQVLESGWQHRSAEQTLPVAQDMSATMLIGAGDPPEGSAVGGGVDIASRPSAGEPVAGCREASGAGVRRRTVVVSMGATVAKGDDVDDEEKDSGAGVAPRKWSAGAESVADEEGSEGVLVEGVALTVGFNVVSRTGIEVRGDENGAEVSENISEACLLLLLGSGRQYESVSAPTGKSLRSQSN